MNEEKAMKAYKALRDMESAADLKKAGFTLSDYYEAQEVLKAYARNNGEEGTSTLNKAVADWYKRQGFEGTRRERRWLEYPLNRTAISPDPLAGWL